MSRFKVRYIGLVIFIGLALAALTMEVFGANRSFNVSVSRNKVAVGKIFRLSLTFNGVKNIPAPELPKIYGFEVEYMGPATGVLIVNGQTTSSVTHMYTLVPLKPGKFEIGPFTYNYGGDTYASDVTTVEVVEDIAGRASSEPRVTYDESRMMRDRVFLSMTARKQKAYINEIIPVSIKLYVNNVPIRDIQYPEFNQKSFSVNAFEKPEQRREYVGRIPYEAVEFKTYIFAAKAGKFVISPAHIKCNILVEKRKSRFSGSGGFFGDDMLEDFFGGYDIFPLEVESGEIPVTILALPEEGKPDDFAGAVGNFNFTVEASPLEVRVGDPITLKVEISGNGNFNTVMCPAISTGEEFKIYEPQVFQEGDSKVFEQVVIPIEDTVKEIPAVRFTFFDTETESYRTISSDPIPIKVLKLKKGEEAPSGIFEPVTLARKEAKKETLGSDIVYIKEAPGALGKKGAYVFKNKFFIAVNTLAAAFLMLLLAAHKRKKRIHNDIRYARRLRAPRKAKTNLRYAKNLLDKEHVQEFYGAVFKTLQEYLGDKFHLPTHGITVTVVDDVLKPKGADPGIRETLKSLFEECDLVRYAASDFDKQKMINSFKKTREVIDYFERAKI